MAVIQTIPLPFELRCAVESVDRSRSARQDGPGEQDWVLALVQKQGRLVVSLLWRMLGSEHDALDAYQSTLCRMMTKGREAIGSNRAGYFYRAAMNAGIEMLRVQRRRQRHWATVLDVCGRRSAERAASSNNPAGGCSAWTSSRSWAPAQGSTEEEDELLQLRAAITRLPPHLRDVIVLREMAGLPYRQVSAILNIGPATARLYRRQAVLRLAENLRRKKREVTKCEVRNAR